MATEAVEHSAHNQMRASSAPPMNGRSSRDDTHEREKQIVASARQNQLSPFRVSDRAGRNSSVSAQNLRLGDFTLLRTLGTGTFARVWLARLSGDERKDRVYALKILRKADVIKLKQVEHVLNERKTLAAVSGYPFITNMIASFSDDQCLYMLLDYCPGGEIFSYLRRARRFNETTTKFYAAEITMTIEYMHDIEGVAYRDLKPENILLDADGHIKLVDFGFAKQLHDRETYTLCGTPEYLSPEVIRNSGHGLAVDWWALGILIYEFLVGQPPFWDQSPIRLYEQIVAGRLRFPQTMSGAAQNIISLLCKTNPTERLGYISGGSRRVKSHPFFDGIDWDDLLYHRIKGPIIPRVDHPADTGNFEEYPDPETRHQNLYTDELRKKYEPLFSGF